MLNTSFFTFEPDKQVFHFLDTHSNGIPLRSIVKNVTGHPGTQNVPTSLLYLKLGRLRCFAYYIQLYNDQLGSHDVYYLYYIKKKTLDLLSGVITQTVLDKPIQAPGLIELIQAIEHVYQDTIKEAHDNLQQHLVTFDSLQQVFQPGCLVAGLTSCGVYSGFRVVSCYYEERRSLLGTEKSFHLQLEYIAMMGQQCAIITFDEVMSGWMQKSRSIKDLLYYPASQDDLNSFAQCGSMYALLLAKKCAFMGYQAGSFYMHGGSTSSKSMSANRIHGGGRMVIDHIQASLLGHHASSGMDEPTQAMIQCISRYKRALGPTASRLSPTTEGFLLFDHVPKQVETMTWPAVVGFSFTLKSWGHVLVSGLEDIQFNDKAFDELVLDPGRKRLIQALVRFGGKTAGSGVQDIIAGKSGGSIFLLHGPPGVGKTLTAEAIAEVLHRPLYYISMGELGTVPETVEQRLKDILSLCEGWNALALLDEADAFLEKRKESDFVRNAMVCVLLRLIEYHSGILFLTTNRVQQFDPAFESRVTVALKYDALSPSARIQVWQTLVNRIPSEIEKKELDYETLGQYELNGRQIHNAIRLSLALALDAQVPLSMQVLLETLTLMEQGRSDLKTGYSF